MFSSGTDREGQIDQVASEVYAAMGIPDEGWTAQQYSDGSGARH